MSSSMWWQGPNPRRSSAAFKDSVPVRPNPAPMTSSIRPPQARHSLFYPGRSARTVDTGLVPDGFVRLVHGAVAAEHQEPVVRDRQHGPLVRLQPLLEAYE